MKNRSKDIAVQTIRASFAFFFVVRAVESLVPPTRLYATLFTSARHIALYFAVFEWQKIVVDTSYKTGAVLCPTKALLS